MDLLDQSPTDQYVSPIQAKSEVFSLTLKECDSVATADHDSEILETGLF